MKSLLGYNQDSEEAKFWLRWLRYAAGCAALDDSRMTARYHTPVRSRILCGVAAATALVAGCSTEPEPPATIVVSAGQESDAFTRDPVPTSMTIRAIDVDGAAVELTNIPWPPSSFDISDLEKTSVAAFEAILQDDAGQPLLRGQTVFYSLWTLYGFEVPLFVGRVNEFSRPVGAIPTGRSGGCVGVVGSQFLVVAGGTKTVNAVGETVASSTLAGYDLAAWDTLAVELELPRAPTAMPIVEGRYALLINDDGATWFDFASYANAEATAPSGTTFADVSGGKVVFGDDGTAYVVGATRASAESDVVLRISPAMSLDALHLATPRTGAAATWVTGRGLVVTGGSATGAGVEVLEQDAASFAQLPFPADPTSGAGAVALDDHRLVLAGGMDPTTSAPALSRVLDLSCAASCAAADIGVIPGSGLRGAAAYLTDSNAVLVIGEEQAGDTSATKAFVIEGIGGTATSSEIASREPRTGAVSVALMGNLVGVIGGYAADDTPVRSLEVFVPR